MHVTVGRNHFQYGYNHWLLVSVVDLQGTTGHRWNVIKGEYHHAYVVENSVKPSHFRVSSCFPYISARVTVERRLSKQRYKNPSVHIFLSASCLSWRDKLSRQFAARIWSFKCHPGRKKQFKKVLITDEPGSLLRLRIPLKFAVKNWQAISLFLDTKLFFVKYFSKYHHPIILKQKDLLCLKCNLTLPVSPNLSQ